MAVLHRFYCTILPTFIKISFDIKNFFFVCFEWPFYADLPGHVAQSVTFLATNASLTADPGFASLILARSNTFVEIDHELISTVILQHSAILLTCIKQ